MGIEVKTNINALMKKTGGDVEKVASEIAIAKLKYLGDAFVKDARDEAVGNYTDRTVNLRSSIGYVVLHDGDVIKEYFKKDKGKGEKGVEEARKLATLLAGQNSRGYVLICLAGMEYALYVELQDYNVISGSEVAVRRLWRKLFK